MTLLILNKNIYIYINLSNCSTRFKGFYAINRFDTLLNFVLFVLVFFFSDIRIQISYRTCTPYYFSTDAVCMCVRVCIYKLQLYIMIDVRR